MDWAVGLAAKSGRLVAKVTQEGAVDLVDLAALQDLGIPGDTSTRRGRVHLNFSNWTRVEAVTYLEAFGLVDESAATSAHQVFSAMHKGCRLVVPALVWIRALFRPSEHLLPLVFGPHFLDRVSCICSEGTSSQVVLEANLASLTQRKRLSCAEQAVLWMRAHPSVASMVASVHRYAMEGVIGLDLPMGRAELAVRGKRIGKTLFVTDMSIQVTEAGEAPIPDLASAIGRYVLTGSCAENEGNTSFKAADFTGIPRHLDGSCDVTDEEWSAISGCLRTGKKATSLDQRAIFDGLLCKLSTGMAWKVVPYRAGNHLNAIHAFRNWAGRGVLQKVLEILREFRTPSAEATEPPL